MLLFTFKYMTRREREVNHITELFICTYRKIIIRGGLIERRELLVLVVAVLQLVLLGSTGLVILPLRDSVNLWEDVN